MPSWDNELLPEMRIDHFLSMCDDTGLFQHAVHSVPDRNHGYCVDDNARALLLACALNHHDERPLSELLTARLAAFVQHAWNPATGRFRNFMSFDRRWLEDKGSDDSHGRTLWALGECRAPGREHVAAADGPPPYSRKPCQPSRNSAPREPGRSRCSGWTLTSPPVPKDFRASRMRKPACRQVDAHSVARRNQGLGVVRGRAGVR